MATCNKTHIEVTKFFLTQPRRKLDKTVCILPNCQNIKVIATPALRVTFAENEVVGSSSAVFSSEMQNHYLSSEWPQICTCHQLKKKTLWQEQEFNRRVHGKRQVM